MDAKTARICYEDFKVGEVSTFGPRLVTREEIISFASEFDPQPMHLDEEAAKKSLLKGLSASGWHTCAMMMRMLYDGFISQSSSLGGAWHRRNALDQTGSSRRRADLPHDRARQARFQQPPADGFRPLQSGNAEPA